jgi:hypothetical protein
MCLRYTRSVIPGCMGSCRLCPIGKVDLPQTSSEVRRGLKYNIIIRNVVYPGLEQEPDLTQGC